MKTIDITQDSEYLQQYVDLRNLNHKFLYTGLVTLGETKEWLNRTKVFIVGLVEDKLYGIGVIYPQKCNEVAIFSSPERLGLGGLILNAVELKARKEGLKRLFAWTKSSSKTFLRKGYTLQGESIKEYQGERIRGNYFFKELR